MNEEEESMWMTITTCKEDRKAELGGHKKKSRRNQFRI